MASIEEILNASDSDDEFGEPSKMNDLKMDINLESLLEDDDDDEADNKQFLSSKSFIADQSVISNIVEDNAAPLGPSFSATVPFLRERFSMISESMSTGGPQVKKFPAIDCNEDNATGHFTLGDKSSITSNADALATKDERLNFLVSLDMADLREQRNIISSTTKDVISALQMKRSKSPPARAYSSDVSTSISVIQYTEMEVLSTQLRRNSSYKQHGPGIATAIHVHKRFFVIGTSSGLLLLFDRSQEIRQVIGSSSPQGSRCYKAVTAIDALNNGTVLLCGYLTGEIALWDVAKGVALKRVTDLHTCRICRLQFINNLNDPGSSTAIPSEFTIVSVDAKGVVNRGHFSKSLWSSLNAEFDLLLDGQSGIVLDMSTLPSYYEDSDRASAGIGDARAASPLLSDMNFVAFNSLTRTYIVQIQPVIRVIHRWAAPTNNLNSCQVMASMGSNSIKAIPASSLDWAWTMKRQYRWPVLARAWGEVIQILCLDCGSENSSSTSSVPSDSRFVFTILSENVIDTGGGGILSVKWLDNDRMILISASHIFVVNADLEILEKANLPSNLASSITASVEVRNPDEAVPASIYVSNSCLFVLSPESLMQLYFQSWKQQADQLIRDGKWLEALATVLESCGLWTDGAEKKETRVEERNKTEVEQYIRKYVDLAVSQPTLMPSYNLSNTAAGPNGSIGVCAKSHYHLVSGVCIEYCIAAGRPKLLFGELFDAFANARQGYVFLEALEPYILRQSIRSLPTHILVQMVEAEDNSNFSSLERCIVYLDLQQADCEFLSKMLLEKKMYSGFLYVYSYGISDVVNAFRILFKRMNDVSRQQQTQISPGRRASSSILIPLPSPEEAEIGYKLLLFIKYTSSGQIFPRGEQVTISQSSFASITSVLQFLIRENFEDSVSRQDSPSEWQQHRFPYLSYLALIDAGAAMFCITKGLHFLELQGLEAQQLVQLYKQLFSFCFMIDAENKNSKVQQYLVECCATHLCQGSLPLPLNIISILIKYATSVTPRILAETLMMNLAKGQVHSVVGATIRESLEEHNFWRAALSIPTQKKQDNQLIIDNFEKSLSFYLSAAQSADAVSMLSTANSMKMVIFDFVDETFAALNLENIPVETMSMLGRIVATNLPQLAEIHLDRTRVVVYSYLLGQVEDILEATQSHPSLQLDFMSRIVEHVERNSVKDLSEFLSEAEIVTYIKLLISFSPSQVFSFLSNHGNYPIEECLALCRENNIPDASALLLEKMGEQQAAISLLLSDFSKRVHESKKSIEALLKMRDPAVMDILAMQSSLRSDAVVALPAYACLNHIVECITALCSRCGTGDNLHASELWFNALDHFLEEKRKYPVVQ